MLGNSRVLTNVPREGRSGKVQRRLHSTLNPFDSVGTVHCLQAVRSEYSHQTTRTKESSFTVCIVLYSVVRAPCIV